MRNLILFSVGSYFIVKSFMNQGTFADFALGLGFLACSSMSERLQITEKTIKQFFTTKAEKDYYDRVNKD
jgi:hypothetical protein